MEPTSPTGGDFSIAVARERLYNCKAKSLLYGGGDRPETPIKEGKKSVPHGQGAGAPFATYEGAMAPAQAGSPGKNVRKPMPQPGASKIGAGDFDPSVYSANIQANAANMAASKAKNYGSGGVMPERQQPPVGHGDFHQQQQQAPSNVPRLIGGKFRKPDPYSE